MSDQESARRHVGVARPPQAAAKRPKTTTVGVKMSKALRNAFHEAAMEEGMSLSAWIRRAAILQARRQKSAAL